MTREEALDELAFAIQNRQYINREQLDRIFRRILNLGTHQDVRRWWERWPPNCKLPKDCSKIKRDQLGLW